LKIPARRDVDAIERETAEVEAAMRLAARASA
jgi:hypothetical protein